MCFSLLVIGLFFPLYLLCICYVCHLCVPSVLSCGVCSLPFCFHLSFVFLPSYFAFAPACFLCFCCLPVFALWILASYYESSVFVFFPPCLLVSFLQTLTQKNEKIECCLGWEPLMNAAHLWRYFNAPYSE